jgi:hypothetical protein
MADDGATAFVGRALERASRGEHDHVAQSVALVRIGRIAARSDIAPPDSRPAESAR